MDTINLFQTNVQWADLDPNGHVRHSVYYDWCATTRLTLLQQLGYDTHRFLKEGFGPILFREECKFLREINIQDKIAVRVFLLRSRRDMSRWSFRHELTKNESELAAIVTVDGAWMDLRKRKLTIPPQEMLHSLDLVPRAPEFEWEETQG